jgi:hypothetical protein
VKILKLVEGSIKRPKFPEAASSGLEKSTVVSTIPRHELFLEASIELSSDEPTKALFKNKCSEVGYEFINFVYIQDRQNWCPWKAVSFKNSKLFVKFS